MAPLYKQKGDMKMEDLDFREITNMFNDMIETQNWYIGTNSGGIDAPHILIAIDVQADGASAQVSWKLPSTCGLSDVRYHPIDTSVHRDMYRFDNGKISCNGDPNIFGDARSVEWADDGMAPEEKMAAKFYAKWGFENPYDNTSKDEPEISDDDELSQ